MPTLTVTVGLPGCGKNTWASQEVKKARSKTVILNLDDLRSTLIGGNIHDYKYSKESEKYIRAQQYNAAELAIKNNWNIIVADTNLNEVTFNTWKIFAEQMKYKFVVHDFFKEFKKGKTFHDDFFAMNAYVKQCKEWNLRRYDSVPEEVIDRMADQYLYSTIKFPVLEADDGYRYIIVDIDGTIAHMGDRRSPYDESKVHLDEPDWEIMNCIDAEYEKDTKRTRIIVMSGRHNTCQEATELWLQTYGFPYHYIYMRDADDNRPDDQVKFDLYMKHVYGTGKRVVKVYDDRKKVVDMWRKRCGLKVLQVDYGNF
jgi:predicted kinase